MSLKSSAFLETIIGFLLPYFVSAAADPQDARSEIIDTLASYATRTRAETLQAAQIIACGMTSLEVLAEAKAADMSASQRIRYRGCANGLNRSTVNMENLLNRRLASDVPQVAGPDNNRSGAYLQQARAAIDAHRDRLAMTVPPARPSTREERNKRLWAGAMMDALRQMGLPDGSQPPA